MRRVQFEAEVIERTGWDFAQLDACPYDRLVEIVRYWNIKAEYEADEQARAMDKARSR